MSGKPRLTAKQRNVMKDSICKILGKSPIIENACQKVGISRMTLSRWRKKDKKFSQKIDDILAISRESVNDLAESKMIQGISDGNTNMIKFWLTNNCDRYKKKFKEKSVNAPQIINWNVDPSPFMTGGLNKKKSLK